MPFSPQEVDWGFGPVFGFLDSDNYDDGLDHANLSPEFVAHTPGKETPDTHNGAGSPGGKRLGNFQELFALCGISSDAPLPLSPVEPDLGEITSDDNLMSPESYDHEKKGACENHDDNGLSARHQVHVEQKVSDKADDYVPTADPNADQGPCNDSDSSAKLNNSFAGMTKKQRKKARRRTRKAEAEQTNARDDSDTSIEKNDPLAGMSKTPRRGACNQPRNEEVELNGGFDKSDSAAEKPDPFAGMTKAQRKRARRQARKVEAERTKASKQQVTREHISAVKKESTVANQGKSADKKSQEASREGGAKQHPSPTPSPSQSAEKSRLNVVAKTNVSLQDVISFQDAPTALLAQNYKGRPFTRSMARALKASNQLALSGSNKSDSLHTSSETSILQQRPMAQEPPLQSNTNDMQTVAHTRRELSQVQQTSQQVTKIAGSDSGLIPRTVRHMQPPKAQPSQISTAPIQPLSVGNILTPSFAIRPQVERHFNLFNRLLCRFPEDTKTLVAPMQLCNGGASVEGIHVFVDASNIMIGFKDLLRSYGIKPFFMSFDSLALVMERRRPVAKRIFAGSQREASPLPDVNWVIGTSKAVGYENNVQEQVFIRREDTDRKKFFRDVKRIGWSKAAQRHAGGVGGSGSDSEMGPPASPTHSAPKWVEQGVDELLHLKMCQSIIDTEVPSTMVLATGDGAQAEYSDGFLAHVERALNKGWKVELISWRQQTNGGYRNKRFRQKWGDRFRIIELDEYLESLIDTT